MAISRPDKKHRNTFRFGPTSTGLNPSLQRLKAMSTTGGLLTVSHVDELLGLADFNTSKPADYLDYQELYDPCELLRHNEAMTKLRVVR